MSNDYHTPVLVKEVLEALRVHEGGRYIDATLGDGGHTKQMADRGGVVLGIDQDPKAIERAGKRLEKEMERKQVMTANTNFEQLTETAKKEGFHSVDGILIDLGMSSFQLESGRGFSFQIDEPLDMRMSPSLGVTAADLVNALSKKELILLLTKFGQEMNAPRIVQAIVTARKNQPIKTTKQLSDIVESVSFRYGRLHPATKVFMSLRMAVNDELGTLEHVLPQTVELLKEHGRLAIISFHEGEDRIVKNFMKETQNLSELFTSPHIPTDEEIRVNPRSRSAKLRVAERRGAT